MISVLDLYKDLWKVVIQWGRITLSSLNVVKNTVYILNDLSEIKIQRTCGIKALA